MNFTLKIWFRFDIKVQRQMALIFVVALCGVHELEAKRDDENFVYAAVWEYKGENEVPELTKEPLNFEFVHLAKRNYKD